MIKSMIIISEIQWLCWLERAWNIQPWDNQQPVPLIITARANKDLCPATQLFLICIYRERNINNSQSFCLKLSAWLPSEWDGARHQTVFWAGAGDGRDWEIMTGSVELVFVTGQWYHWSTDIHLSGALCPGHCLPNTCLYKKQMLTAITSLSSLSHNIIFCLHERRILKGSSVENDLLKIELQTWHPLIISMIDGDFLPKNTLQRY